MGDEQAERASGSGKEHVRLGRATEDGTRQVVERHPGMVRPLLDPIDRAIRDLSEALDAALDDLHGRIDALTAENDDLRSRLEALEADHAGHVHDYAPANPGSGGTMWFALQQVKAYVDEDMPNANAYDSYGLYLRENAATSGQSKPVTGPPTDQD